MIDIIKPGAILFAISLVASLSLGFVSEITKEPIAIAEKKAETEAQSELLPDASDFEEITDFEITNSVQKIVVGKKDGQEVGYLFSAFPKGYAGEISMVVAIDTEGVVKGVKILKHSETPGLGAKASQPEFTSSFVDKKGSLSVVKQAPSDNEIQAITSATITSRAVTEGVNDAQNIFETISE